MVRQYRLGPGGACAELVQKMEALIAEHRRLSSAGEEMDDSREGDA